MEPEIIERIKKIINDHEASLQCYYCSNEADKIAHLLNDYQRRAAKAVADKKQFLEDATVHFRAIVMIAEMIGMAGTHGEKAARIRGLIELLNNTIRKLRTDEMDVIFGDAQSFFSWNSSDYPYRAVLEKVDRIRSENEDLKARIRELEGSIDSEQ